MGNLWTTTLISHVCMFHLARGRGQELMKHISKGPGAIFPLEKISLGGCVAINDQQSTDIPSKDSAPNWELSSNRTTANQIKSEFVFR